MGRVMSIAKYIGVVMFSVIIGLEGENYLFFEKETLFRITSTVIQVFAALLALVGMFAVYRMQIIQNEISQLELLRNERFFQKRSLVDELEGHKKLKKFMKRFRLKGTQNQVEEIDKAIVEELELDYGKRIPEGRTDTIVYISEEMFIDFITQLRQLEGKIEGNKKSLDNIDCMIVEIEDTISEKKGKNLQIRKETEQMITNVLAFLVFCLPILPLSSLEINDIPSENLIVIFLVFLIILLSILVLLDIFRTLKTII